MPMVVVVVAVAVEGLREELREAVLHCVVEVARLDHYRITLLMMISVNLNTGLSRITLTFLPSFPEPRPPPARRVAAAPPIRRENVAAAAAEPRCNCGLPAAQRTVTKDTPNKGRKFWTCDNNKECAFFEFVDDNAPPTTGGGGNARKVIPAKRPLHDRSVNTLFCLSLISPPIFFSQASDHGGENAGDMRCGCDLQAVSRTVVKEGPNVGRKFWTCPNNENARCGFFQWEDGDQGHNNAAQSRGGAGGGGQTGECFKWWVFVLAIYSLLLTLILPPCSGQAGHWSTGVFNRNFFSQD